jgi:biopolymer transport protein ExbD
MKISMGPRHRFPLISEINMIPLIDVSLVLLIIFMVVTPFLVSSQIKINLPKAVTGIPPDLEPVKIQITAQQTFYVDGRAILLQDLASVLNSRFKQQKSPVVLIEADARVPFELVVKAMDQSKAQGAQKLGVAVADSP